MALDAQRSDIATLIDKAYPKTAPAACSGSSPPSGDGGLITDAYFACLEFLTSLTQVYFAKRLEYPRNRRLLKLPRFEVLELLVNADDGLYGFRVHFSNGSCAEFARYSDSTTCTNVILDTPINFMAGELDKLRPEWRVGERRLYEIGLPGRYNKLGEWKPIVYPGSTELFQEEIRELSGDPDVQSALFYLFCTGYRVIEFVAATTLDLPIAETTIRFGEKLNLWKCPQIEELSISSSSVNLYDGWLELESTDPESIRNSINMIGIGLRRITFAYGAVVNWHVKYSTVLSSPSSATPSDEDLDYVNLLLHAFPASEDAMVLDIAIDWFNHGKSSHNVFMRFLCYYIAIESVAIAITEGTADFGLSAPKVGRQEKRQAVKSCIEEKHNRLYSADPIRFTREAYFDCVVSLKKNTRRVAALVFGADHEYVRALFERDEGSSLSDIRGKLAHGGLTSVDSEHEGLVKGRVYEIERICKEFLTRLILRLKPSEPLPSWSQRHRSSMSFSDPRSTLSVTDERSLPTRDWRIRSEWCE